MIFDQKLYSTIIYFKPSIHNQPKYFNFLFLSNVHKCQSPVHSYGMMTYWGNKRTLSFQFVNICQRLVAFYDFFKTGPVFVYNFMAKYVFDLYDENVDNERRMTTAR